MKSSSYSPYIRDHGSRIWSTYGSSIDVFFTIFPMNWRTRRATLANSSASRSHRQPKYMHQNVSICQTSAAICAAIRELNRRGDLTTKTKPYGPGQYTDFKFDAQTSVKGAKGNVRTTLKIHDADPTGGTNSRTGTTLGIEQGKGYRRVVPDASSDWGGRWVDKATASEKEWDLAH